MLRTRVTEMFGLDHPIISAPMAGTSGGALAAAVSAAGGLGMIGASVYSPEQLAAEIRLVRDHTDRNFGVGFITSAPNTDELMDVAIEHQVPVIAHAFADPGRHIAAASQVGIKTIVQVQSVELARRAVAAGADAIAVQGIEAGGHTGYVGGTLPMVPAVIDAIGDIPVVAAGGIADGRGLAAVLMLGADGAWMGTRFVASEESTSNALSKQAVVDHGADEWVLTRIYDILTHAPFPDDIGERILNNPFIEAWTGFENELDEHRTELLQQIQQGSESGDLDIIRVLAGNSAGLVHEILPAGEIVRRVVAEAEMILRSRPSGIIIEGEADTSVA